MTRLSTPISLMFRVALAAALTATLAPAGSAGAAARVRLGFDATSHAPKVGKPWTATVTARRGSTALRGRVSLDVLYGGRVVAHVSSGRLSGGVYRKTVRWPARSAGYPLQVRATVRAANVTRTALYAVRVSK